MNWVRLLALAWLFAWSAAAQVLQPVNLGTAPNDGTGDPLRTALQKLNNNDANLWQQAFVNQAATNGLLTQHKVVDTFADLLQIDPETTRSVEVRGYWGAGAGGGFTAVVTNSIVGTNARGGMVLALGGTKSWLNINPVYNVKEFGARGTSWVDSNDVVYDAGDDQPYIQAAIDYCYTRSWPGGQIYIPGGGYILESTLRIQRLSEAQARLGYTNTHPAISNYWAPYSRLMLTGDGLSTTLIIKTNATHFGLTIEGKTTYGDYTSNRIQNVKIQNLDIFNIGRDIGSGGISIRNGGFATIENVRTRRGYIGIKLESLSESAIINSWCLTGAYGLWTDYDNTGNGGDVSGVDIIGCTMTGQLYASAALHWYRDLHFIGGFYGTREPGAVATFWASGLGPISNGQLTLTDVGAETTQASAIPILLIGSNGSEGVYSQATYPYTSYTNNTAGYRSVHCEHLNFSYGTTNNPIVIRGPNTTLVGGLNINNSWFDTTLARKLVVIEQDVPDSTVVNYGEGNVPKEMLIKTYDARTNFLTAIQDKNAGNLLNAGWRTMDKGGYVWVGAEAPYTVIDSIAGPFGVQLENGADHVTQIQPYSGSVGLTLRSNTPVLIDFAVKWATTNLSRHLSIRLLDRNTGLYYDPATLGGVGLIGQYTNSYGVWYRYLADFSLPQEANCDRIAFNNFGGTNENVTLGYLAIYSKSLGGDGSSTSPGGATLSTGRYETGHQQWSVANTSSLGNAIGRRWEAGYAVREAWNVSTAYVKGQCVSNGGNIYLSWQAVTGGAAPVHTSGRVGSWDFVATSAAASFQTIQSRSSVEGGVTSVFVLSTMFGLTPYNRQIVQTFGANAVNDGGQAKYMFIAGYAGTTNAYPSANATYLGNAYAVTGGAWVQITEGNYLTKQYSPGIGLTNNVVADQRFYNTILAGSIGDAAIDSSAKLQINSTTRGFLPPRMATAQRDAIASPAEFLVIGNTTTSKLQIRIGGAWVDLH